MTAFDTTTRRALRVTSILLPEAQTVQLFVRQIEPMERVVPDAANDLIRLENEGASGASVFDRILCFAHSPLGAVAPHGARSSLTTCRERRLAL